MAFRLLKSTSSEFEGLHQQVNKGKSLIFYTHRLISKLTPINHKIITTTLASKIKHGKTIVIFSCQIYRIQKQA